MIVDRGGKVTKEFDWEILPYKSEKGKDYALWVDRWMPYYVIPEFKPHVCLSSQSDCSETIQFCTVEHIDELISDLMKARKWIEDGRR
jgi:hypothetical protein